MIQLESPKTSLNSTIAIVDNVSSRVSPWLAPLLYFLAHYFVLPLFFGRIEITGVENLPATGPIILAPTHRAWWDSILVAYAAGRRTTGRDPRFMVSLNEANKGIQGWFIRRLGGFPIDTERPTAAPLRYGVELLKQGEILVIFPEGNYFRDGLLHPLKPGLARIALKTESSYPGLGIQIVPICIVYSQAFPRWGCNVNIRIGPPLAVTDYSNGSSKEKAQQLTSTLETALAQLCAQQIALKMPS